jgi:hypothetical protein
MASISSPNDFWGGTSFFSEDGYQNGYCILFPAGIQFVAVRINSEGVAGK